MRAARLALPPVAALAALAFLAIPAQASAARTIAIDDATGVEPAGNASQPLTFQVRLSQKHPSKPVQVRYGTSPGSADALDYQPSFGTARIPAGKRKAQISVPIRGDLFDEPDETFSVELSEARRASIDDGEAGGLIPANDGGPDGDGDDIPDVDDCAPGDPNPAGQLQCFAPATIYEINQGTHPVGTRVYVDHVLITARADAGPTSFGATIPGDPGYSGQDFSALELRTASEFLEEGARTRVLGTVRADRLDVSAQEPELGSEPLPGPVTLTPSELAAGPDAKNGLLVRIENVSIESATASEWTLAEEVRVRSGFFFGFPQYGPPTAFESLTGHATTRGSGIPALYPRDLSDIDPTVAMLLEFTATNTCLLAGEQDVVIGEVVIDEAQANDTVVTLEADDPEVLTVPATVTVPAGQTTADVIADAAADPPEEFTEITATLDPFDFTTFVNVSSEFC